MLRARQQPKALAVVGDLLDSRSTPPAPTALHSTTRKTMNNLHADVEAFDTLIGEILELNPHAAVLKPAPKVHHFDMQKESDAYGDELGDSIAAFPDKQREWTLRIFEQIAGHAPSSDAFSIALVLRTHPHLRRFLSDHAVAREFSRRIHKRAIARCIAHQLGHMN